MELYTLVSRNSSSSRFLLAILSFCSKGYVDPSPSFFLSFSQLAELCFVFEDKICATAPNQAKKEGRKEGQLN